MPRSSEPVILTAQTNRLPIRSIQNSLEEGEWVVGNCADRHTRVDYTLITGHI